MSPKAFISHASEDKERFAIPLATALRARGIDAWVDQWEMQPGDSLVDKIFEEGIKNATVFVIVLSKASIAKPWVRQELNAAVVKRIDDGMKLIPIVLDGCEIPGALKSTLWQRVLDPADFASCLDVVVDAIFGRSRKPPIGDPALYLGSSEPAIPGLSAVDSLVLATLYAEFLTLGSRLAESDSVLAAMEQKGVQPAMVAESVEVLELQGYVETLKAVGGGFKPCGLTTRGVSLILGAKEARLIRDVGFAIINDGLLRTDAIAEAIGQPEPLIHHAFGLLSRDGHLSLSGEISLVKSIVFVRPTLRRILDAEI